MAKELHAKASPLDSAALEQIGFSRATTEMESSCAESTATSENDSPKNDEQTVQQPHQTPFRNARSRHLNSVMQDAKPSKATKSKQPKTADIEHLLLQTKTALLTSPTRGKKASPKKG